MSEYNATIRWELNGGDFLAGRYSREHTWTFDGGVTVPASPAPANVPPPYSNAANVDPEEAFVAAVSSCHMLTYLFLAHRHGVEVDRYEDEAIGLMTRNDQGHPWVAAVTLRPKIAYGGARRPSPAEEERLHHLAHEQCIIANSIKTRVTVDGARRAPGTT